ncbi:hypothetical protein PYK79_30305 [Streptomyces sp. ID05-04B]|uniref:hypothetical protein n=1 Tax=unclassified Streptomyces TaxID=2593676 RepID=UPI001C1FAF7C|nr:MULTISPECIES: hypothetical protein [unclassified Streptomyces]MDX5566695.1 hypothetical protein [Streptomyces sp. ID05-04B]
MRRLTAAGVACALALLLGGCSQQYYDERGKADAPVAGRAGEDTPAEVHNFPDGFGNLATKCVGKGRRGYATTKFVQAEDDDEVVVIPANAVIVDDPGCTGP